MCQVFLHIVRDEYMAIAQLIDNNELSKLARYLLKLIAELNIILNFYIKNFSET
jgi:hypothetical protein